MRMLPRGSAVNGRSYHLDAPVAMSHDDRKNLSSAKPKQADWRGGGDEKIWAVKRQNTNLSGVAKIALLKKLRGNGENRNWLGPIPIRRGGHANDDGRAIDK